MQCLSVCHQWCVSLGQQEKAEKENPVEHSSQNYKGEVSLRAASDTGSLPDLRDSFVR